MEKGAGNPFSIHCMGSSAANRVLLQAFEFRPKFHCQRTLADALFSLAEGKSSAKLRFAPLCAGFSCLKRCVLYRGRLLICTCTAGNAPGPLVCSGRTEIECALFMVFVCESLGAINYLYEFSWVSYVNPLRIPRYFYDSLWLSCVNP